MIAKLLRYAQATLGPVGVAGSQFVLALLMLRQFTPLEFGALSFLLVAFQLSIGLWSALFCAPLPVLLAQARKEQSAVDAAMAESSGSSGTEPAEDILRALFSVSALASVCLAFVFFGVAIWLDLEQATAWAFALYAGVGLLRWFGRAHAYATGTPLRTTFSDMVYSVVLLLGCGLLWWLPSISQSMPATIMLVAAALGLLPFGTGYLRRQFGFPGGVGPYSHVWQKHARWSLVGVLSTEATVNAHSYIVTFVAGPTAFAPLAVSSLFIRPIGVLMSALTEFERPQMARLLAKGDIAVAWRSAQLFRLALLTGWIITAIAAYAVLTYVPHLLFSPAKYAPDMIATAVALWLAIILVRLLRVPDSVLLQAGGSFRPLAMASLVSCGVSLAAVAGALVAYGPLWSLGGVLAGETLFAFAIWYVLRRWFKAAIRA